MAWKNNAVLRFGFNVPFRRVARPRSPEHIGIIQIVNSAVFALWFIAGTMLKRTAMLEFMKTHFTGTSVCGSPTPIAEARAPAARRSRHITGTRYLAVRGSLSFQSGTTSLRKVFRGCYRHFTPRVSVSPLLVRLGCRILSTLMRRCPAWREGNHSDDGVYLLGGATATYKTKIPFLSDEEKEYPAIVCGGASWRRTLVAPHGEGRGVTGDTVNVPDPDTPSTIEAKVPKVRESASCRRASYTTRDRQNWRSREGRDASAP